MTDTIRHQITDKIKTLFQTILVANGYRTNAGQNVSYWRTTDIEDDKMPAIDFRDLGCSKVRGVIGKFRWELKLEIKIYVSASAASIDSVRDGISDIYKAIDTKTTWDALALRTDQPEGDEIVMKQNNDIIGGATIHVSIIYDAPMWEI